MGNRWDERFKQNEYVYANPFIKQMTPKLNGRHILTIAEGEGRNTVYSVNEESMLQHGTIRKSDE